LVFDYFFFRKSVEKIHVLSKSDPKKVGISYEDKYSRNKENSQLDATIGSLLKFQI
jgi:hypothetical protein